MSYEESRPLLRSDSDGSGRRLSVSSRVTLPSSWRRCLAGMAILLTLTMERVAFYSVTGNLYLYLNHHPMDWMPYNAMNASYIFTGISYLFAIVGGWAADAFLGKFRAVLLGLLVYSGAYSFLVFLSSYGQRVPSICQSAAPSVSPFSNITPATPPPFLINLLSEDPAAPAPLGVLSNEDDVGDAPVVLPGTETCGWMIYLILITVGMSVGTVRSSIAPFGADQYKQAGGKSMRQFFNWYYWCVNIGGFISLGGIAYVQQVVSNGFYIGYLASATALGAALMIFIAGRPWYTVQKPAGSLITNIFKILREAYRSRRRHRLQLERQKSLRIDLPPPDPSALPIQQPTCLDMAKVRYGGSFHEFMVDDVKALGKILVIFTALIPYWIVYFQMQTTFTAQGFHMRLNPFAHRMVNGSHSNDTDPNKINFTIPAAWLTLFDILFLLILIPLMDRLVYPYLDKRHIHMSLLFKISLGMAFAFFSVLVAGGLEYYRLNLIYSDNSTVIIQVVGNTSYAAADLWIFWQVPQYALIGISEVFASVASLEFAYSQSPASMQGIIMGLHCFSTGVGSFLGTGLLEVVRPFWFTSRDYGSLNQSHLDYYFFLLAGIQLFTVLIFNLVAKRCDIAGPGGLLPLSKDYPSTQAPEEYPGPSVRHPRSRMIVPRLKK